MKRCCAANTGRGCDERSKTNKTDKRSFRRMAIEVAKVELKTVQDASGLAGLIAAGKFGADEVIAVIGKTEGNGGVNDFTRILADQACRRVLLKNGTCSEAATHNVPINCSGGSDFLITPHGTIYAR